MVDALDQAACLQPFLACRLRRLRRKRGAPSVKAAPAEPDTSTTAASIQAVFLPLVLRNLSLGPREVTTLEETFEGAFPGRWNAFDDHDGEGEYHWSRRNCRAYRGASSGWAVGGGADGDTLSSGDG